MANIAIGSNGYASSEGLRERLQVTEQRLSDATTTIADLRTERDRLLGIVETQAEQVKRITDARPRRSWFSRWPRRQSYPAGRPQNPLTTNSGR